MSDHPEVPRVEFNATGDSMNIEQAVDRFRQMLLDGEEKIQDLEFVFSVQVRIRPCDCDDTFTGRDEYCPLHGDKA